MDILWIVIVGGIIGWVASIVMGTDGQMGILLNIIIGIVGAALGHFLAPKLGLAPTDTVGRLLVNLGGAVLVILILKVFRVLK